MAQELSQPLAAVGGYIGGVQRAFERAWPDRTNLEHGMAEAAKQLARTAELLQRMRTLGENLRTPQMRSVHARLTESMEVGERLAKGHHEAIRESRTALAQSVLARHERERARIRRVAGREGDASPARATMLANIRLLERVMTGASSSIEPMIEQALRHLLDEERASLAAIEQQGAAGDLPLSETPS